MLTAVLAVIGAIVGASLADEEGLIFGLFIGLIFGFITSLKARVFKLESELSKVSNLLSRVEQQSQKSNELPKHSAQTKPDTPHQAESQWMSIETKELFEPLNSTQENPVLKPINLEVGNVKTKATETLAETHFVETAFRKVKDFFTTGNIVVKVGAIILFFGVAFLLKYAAQRSLLPIEFRLATVIVTAIGMLIIGWRLAQKKREYGLILQGTALGILYLTLFACAKFYQLLPMNLSLIIMLALVVSTGVLAVKQDAKSLALFGSVGGFLAPILMSTGSGSHITLFSYYTLLNLGIFGIAWFKSWRLLNLVGFIFTFVISGLWGYKTYQAELFASTEAFLILFYLLFLSISVLFAFKQEPKLKGYVDGSLIFGLPLISFALQSRLVLQFEYGQAITAAAMGIIYMLLSHLLWQRNKGRFKLLSESFLALGLTFSSLAIPLYFDGRWTAAVWSLEGAALVWVGLRQGLLIPRIFGLILAVGASLSFISSVHGHLVNSIAVINSTYLGMVLISMAALFIAYLYEKNRAIAFNIEYRASVWFIVAGLLFWFASGLIEIAYFSSSHYEWKLSLIFLALTTLFQAILSYQFKWKNISLSSALFLPAVAYIICGLIIDDIFSYEPISPFRYLGFIAWPLALFVHLLVLCRNEKRWYKSVTGLWHAAGVWIVSFIILWAIVALVDNLVPVNATWSGSSAGLTLAMISGILLIFGNKSRWPIGRYTHAYYIWGLLPLMLLLVLWQLVSNTESGDPILFSYLPVLNPLDISQALVMVVMVYWLSFISKIEGSPVKLPAKVLAVIAGIMSFIWINTVIARTVHAFAQVPYQQSDIMASGLFQMSTSIVWSVLAIILMVAALKTTSRIYWFAGAALFALVVLKLLFIDLADSDSISRIVSFLAVGGLMLLVGYLSPLPPKTEE